MACLLCRAGDLLLAECITRPSWLGVSRAADRQAGQGLDSSKKPGRFQAIPYGPTCQAHTPGGIQASYTRWIELEREIDLATILFETLEAHNGDNAVGLCDAAHCATPLPSLHPYLPAVPVRGEQQPGGCQRVDRRAGREIHPCRLLYNPSPLDAPAAPDAPSKSPR